MKIAYSYCRMSTPEQLKGDSLRRQTQRSDDWCKRNGYTLDTTLNLHDLGVSAFHGKNAETGRLKAFLDAVQEGRVPRGSTLLVENLDRLTRATIRQALRLFLSILESGIRLVTLDPEYVFEPDGGEGDMTQLLIAITWMARGHDESARKSSRMGAAWGQKRATATTKKLTSKGPTWLRLSDDKTHWIEIPERVLVVKRIFRMALEGIGSHDTAITLNREGVPVFGRGNGWHKSYILKVLRNRAVIGEYQPHVGNGWKNRKPVGEPIKDYFPRVVSDADFYRAQAALTGRVQKRGPIGDRVDNLFTGLIRDARDGSPMTISTKTGDKKTKRLLVSSAAARGVPGSRYLTFSYQSLEEALLKWTKELGPEDLFPDLARETRNQLAVAEGRLGDLDVRIGAFRESLINDPNFATLLGVVRELETERTTLAATVERLRAELHLSSDKVVTHAIDLVEMMERAEGEELIDLRTRLRGAFSALISEIWVLVSQVDQFTRQAMVQVHFVQGGYRRFVVFTHKGKLTQYEDQGVPFGQDEIQAGEPATWDLRHWDGRGL